MRILLGYCLWASVLLAPFSHADDDEQGSELELEKFEYGFNQDVSDVFAFEGQAALGNLVHGLRIKFQGESEQGEFEENEWQLLYSRRFARRWHWQMGLTQDFAIEEAKPWLTFALSAEFDNGIALELSSFNEEQIGSTFRLDIEHEWELTETFLLVSDAEFNFNEKNEDGNSQRFSRAELGARLAYQVNDVFAPYLGLFYETSALDDDDEEHDDESSSTALFVIGFRLEV